MSSEFSMDTASGSERMETRPLRTGNGGPRQAALAARQALERERDELPAHVTNYQRELDATPQEQKERRERLEWQIRRVQKRIATIQAWLTEGQPPPVRLARRVHDLCAARASEPHSPVV